MKLYYVLAVIVGMAYACVSYEAHEDRLAYEACLAARHWFAPSGEVEPIEITPPCVQP